MRNYQDPNDMDTQPQHPERIKAADERADGTAAYLRQLRRCMYHRGEWPRVPEKPVAWCLRCCPEDKK